MSGFDVYRPMASWGFSFNRMSNDLITWHCASPIDGNQSEKEIEIWKANEILGMDNEEIRPMVTTNTSDQQQQQKCFIRNFLLLINTMYSVKLCILSTTYIFEASYPCFLSQSVDCTKLDGQVMRDLTE